MTYVTSLASVASAALTVSGPLGFSPRAAERPRFIGFAGSFLKVMITAPLHRPVAVVLRFDEFFS